ncbi:VOC family protein [Pseudomonas hefeiensis]|uniref:VOC family protein n=1 Tax=Pseudomonas hefeiensis TaxID=2738125 RepID=A0ABY9GGR5_9PSED|nr:MULTISPECIES: VOC family protein [unclassified Pseudomonas]WLH14808.1 VOC family protein [Pseudomonas sp. FP205]WLH97859.1 VOC family protein [Pseudomonas sp. FP53]WLI42134.1 VOC family protein [Pseudomonas sp. FP821]
MENLFNVGGVELPQPFKARRLGHVGFYYDDLAAAERFYTDILGLRVSDYLKFDPEQPPAAIFISHCTDHHSMACISSGLADKCDVDYLRGVTLNQISFQVGTLEEVVNGYRFIKERKIPIWRVGRDFPGSNWAFYCRDPDGYHVELFYGMEQIGWNRISKPVAMREVEGEEPSLPQRSEQQEIHDALNDDVELYEGHKSEDLTSSDYVVGGVTLPRPFKVNKVGPVHLFVRDVEVSEAFYHDLFGLVVTEEVVWRGHRAVFMRLGADHHVLGLYPLAMRQELGFSELTTVMGTGIEVCSYLQLRDAVEYLDGLGLKRGPKVPSELLPGIDHAISYIDPAGHCVLLYFSMEQIGWDGKPRPAQQRRKIEAPWPESIAALSDTYADQTLLGPIG